MAVRYPRLNVIFSDRSTATPFVHIDRKATTSHLARHATAGLVIDSGLRTAAVDGRELDLTYMEFELLAHLVGSPLRVHSRRQLMETLWGRPDNGDTRTVSTHIARIRRKVGPAHRAAIATVRQIGYKYDPRLSESA